MAPATVHCILFLPQPSPPLPSAPTRCRTLMCSDSSSHKRPRKIHVIRARRRHFQGNKDNHDADNRPSGWLSCRCVPPASCPHSYTRKEPRLRCLTPCSPREPRTPPRHGRDRRHEVNVCSRLSTFVLLPLGLLPLEVVSPRILGCAERWILDEDESQSRFCPLPVQGLLVLAKYNRGQKKAVKTVFSGELILANSWLTNIRK